MLMSSRRRAKKAGLDHNLSKEDIVIPEYCPILGLKLECGEKKIQPNSPTLDRIKPQLGYVKGNVQVISSKANFVKSNLLKEDLLKFAKWVIDNQDIL